MKNEKELHEINEEELEQISGGSSGDAHFRCPVCGKETWLQHVGFRPPACTYCIITSGKNVTMELV